MDERLFRHGAFSWFELMTGDVEGAGDFYGRLFGWTVEKMEMQNGMTYNVVKVNGEAAGGIMAMPPQAGAMPSMWGIYVTVDDVDATASAVKDMGGQVLMGPQDIPEVGRFCVIQDPQGAVLSVITYKAM
ncbi:MAG: VOC family protein [bacterium]|nr:MAG: VOC family protein [bacterium]